MERVLGKRRVGTAEREPDVFLRHADRVPRRPEHQVACQLALIGEVRGDAGTRAGRPRASRSSPAPAPQETGVAMDDGRNPRGDAPGTGEARKLHRGLPVQVGADEPPSRSAKRDALAAAGPRARNERSCTGLSTRYPPPEIVAPDQHLAAVNHDELGVRPREALHVSEEVQERMAATLRVRRAPGVSRSPDVSDDNSAAASAPSGGDCPTSRRTAMGRPLAASTARPARGRRERVSGTG